jgi:hypothetical protein
MKNILFVPVPSSWYGKPWGAVMTFEEALKALDSDEQKQAVALLREIDMQLGIDADYAKGRACFRAGEIRILDSSGIVQRTIPFCETDRAL